MKIVALIILVLLAAANLVLLGVIIAKRIKIKKKQEKLDKKETI